ncbi:hypothetical protein DES39_1929 [Orbus hercynius]|uniref:YnhF family membrane protein n=1 Tax=Orbus hercynius TaxID=593135 RepID=A0A495RBZ9_9GAMM|nr:YnhF family membrane protein [Orbus hercynius]RKS84714.1 hypothetical protein DES39_1929 [Orbus hercynius]
MSTNLKLSLTVVVAVLVMLTIFGSVVVSH